MLHSEFIKAGSGVVAEFLNGPVDALVEGPGVSQPSEPVTDWPDFKQVYCRNDDLLTERSTTLVLQMSHSVMNGDLLFTPLLKLSRCKSWWRDFFSSWKSKKIYVEYLNMVDNLVCFSDDRSLRNSCTVLLVIFISSSHRKVKSYH